MVDETIGNYRLLEKIGEGGMGEVFKGIDLMVQREVAIKFLRPEFARRKDIVERFCKEAMVLGRLNHPNIATLYNFVRHEDKFFMVMEFVHGQTLDRLIAAHRAGMPWKWALLLFAQALQAIDHAHRHGIVHRDVKPANMMIREGNLLSVLDFGIARVLGSSHMTRMTRTGVAVGTLKYMSPEQIRGREVDARADIYSLGVLLYEMLAGHPPFEEPTEYGLMKAHIEQPPVPLCDLLPDLPPPLSAAAMQSLGKEPEDRIQTAADFLGKLEALLPNTAFTLDGQVIDIPARLAPRQITPTPDRVAPSVAENPNAPELEPTTLNPEIHHVANFTDHQATQVASIRGNDLAAGENRIGRNSRDGKAGEKPLSKPEIMDEDERTLSARPVNANAASRTLLARWRANARTRFRSAWEGRRRPLLLAAVIASLLAMGGILYKSEFIKFLLITREADKIQVLLKQAEAALADNRLVGPDENNAEGYLVQVFGISPQQPEARRLLEQLSNRIIEQGYDAVRKNEAVKSRAYLNDARRLAEKYQIGDGKILQLAEAVNSSETQSDIDNKTVREKNAKHVAELMAKARAAASAGQLVQPKGVSMLDFAQQILQIEPSHAGARQLVADSLDLLLNHADEALKTGDIAQAKFFKNEAMALTEKYRLANAELLAMTQRIAEKEQRLADARQKDREDRRASAKSVESKDGLDQASRDKEEARKLAEQKAAKAKEADRLIEKAQKALAANRLLAPSGESAADFAGQALKHQAVRQKARNILEDIVGRIIASGELALANGQLATAQERQQEAERVGKRYGLSGVEAGRLSARLQAAKTSAARPTAVPPPTPAIKAEDLQAQMQQLEARRLELERREQQMQKAEADVKKEAEPVASPPEPKKQKETFIPPSF